MYRRIEVVLQIAETPIRICKCGLGSLMRDIRLKEWDLYIKVPPRRAYARNVRFFFTEEGWAVAGRKVIALLKRRGIQFRVISAGKGWETVWEDRYQAALRPRRKEVR